ncbi:OmpA family protein [Fibrivirga algicola]|uniref:OmpA family protein n=1 Tax=Fibrivirga algicola TaxID=2950420 RepID=A0ABX0QP97_9BACT|nr:OmpA family protein [Fibrivirga algicola]NID12423.1 OmpA family protein [Fibrivirga algicola]
MQSALSLVSHLFRVRRWWLLALLWLPMVGYGQPIQWANRVVAVTSEGKGDGGGRQMKASQALGPPSVLQPIKLNPCAWAPATTDGNTEEWITVEMARPQPIRQVLIAESGAVGAIVRVIIIDSKQGEHVIFSEKQAAIRATDKPIDPMLRVILGDSSLVGQRVKVVINPGRVKGLNQIDAIGITSADKPVVMSVPLAPNIPKAGERENLGQAVNSTGQDVAPVIAPDGKTIYFTRTHKDNIGNTKLPEKDRTQDVWYATQTTDRTWGEAKNLGAPINTTGNNAISSISPDGKTIYLLNIYNPDGTQDFGVSKSTFSKGGWSFPRECKIANHYNEYQKDPEEEKEGNNKEKKAKSYSKMEFTVSPGGTAMVLAIRRKDTEGDRDLYVSFRQPDFTWSEPISMGATVNTAAEECAPFIALDDKTIYFTSEGHPGFGDGDIFVSHRLDDTWTKWSVPENLGPVINTPSWDGYFTIPASGDYAYLSSRANSLGDDDIFRLLLPPSMRPEPVAIISGQVLDAISKKPVSTEVVSGLLENDKDFSKVEYDPETGEYKMVLPTKKAYRLSARKDGYFPMTETIDLSKDKRFRDIRRNLYVMPVQPGAKVVLRGVLFKQSEAELLPGSEDELDQLTGLLTQYPNMTILVEGHTDNQGEWNLNMKLAEDRVQRVKKYLATKGIPEARIQTKAWGPSKPIASNESEEKRKLNRRVEFTILTL